MARTTSAQFNDAYKVGPNLANATQEEQLKMYAYAKLAKEETPEKGGMFNPAAKYKYSAWEEMKKTGVTPDAADTKYVEFVKELFKKYGLKGDAKPEAKTISGKW
ncbi:hypothetical protein K402DRAFT_424340 [Aulographum hederae CBS 113979]|uniref:ACB domain-containing protein n=1 Tax=Aulographum hederae CBS 113979 TaxID=1176131 RepID=A0A6G1GP96_9PEZI|nr:hypothetical protein K402DRAFT_424340 [Aulographum hederae CBS 113979]